MSTFWERYKKDMRETVQERIKRDLPRILPIAFVATGIGDGFTHLQKRPPDWPGAAIILLFFSGVSFSPG